MGLTPDEVLLAARAGDFGGLDEGRDGVADAVRWFADVGDGASALELVARLWRIWFSRGEIDEGAAVAAVALGAAGAASASVDRGRVSYADGLFAFRAGDQERSRARNEEALQVARAVSDPRGDCDALTGLARVALRDGDYRRVIELAQLARRQARAARDRDAEAAPLHLEAAGARLSGDFVRARDLYVQSLELNTELGNDGWIAMELHNLGWVELHLDAVDAAAARFRERDAREENEDAYGRAWRDLNWAAVAVVRGDTAEARSRLSAGEAALAVLRLALDPDDQFELEWLREAIHAGT
jgi:hypothetical protein